MKRTDAVDNLLGLLRADPPFVAWAKGQSSLDAAWDACPDPAWMLWLLGTLEYEGRAQLRRFAIACAQRVIPMLPAECAEALLVAQSVAKGALPEAALHEAYRKARRQAESLATAPGFREGVAAAALAAAAAVRARPIDAATEASREALRALAWTPGASVKDEIAWQRDELRRCVHGTTGPAFERARSRGRGRLSMV